MSFKEKGLREPHPFTIACAHRENGQLEFVIRALGDYTKTLRERVKVGMVADIYAPYGHFKRPSGAAKEIWIGAGVGISPFIAWLQDPLGERFDKATLIYCFNPARAFPPAEQLQGVAEQRGVQFMANSGGTEQLADHLRQLLTHTAPESVHISFCGPKGLLQRVRELMREHGVPAQNLHVELFEFR